jgi:hypothetical protein
MAAYDYKPARVYRLASMTDRVAETHEYYGKSSYRFKEMQEFIDAVCAALGGVAHHNADHHIAYIYRPGDTHILGEIGYADTRLRKVGKDKLQFYARSYGIKNPKISEHAWQHNTYSYSTMSAAVKRAVDSFRPLTASEAIKLTRKEVSETVGNVLYKTRRPLMDTIRALTGESYYGTDFNAPLFRELRYVTFASEELNRMVAKFYEQLDVLRATENVVGRGLHYVGLTDNYGQPVADMCHVPHDPSLDIGTPTRMAAEALPEWAQGRMAVLNMVKPDTYVDGVGMRLDDRIFYIAGDEVNEG